MFCLKSGFTIFLHFFSRYDFFQDDGDTTTTNSDAMSEMSDIESVISTSSSTALAAAAANRKRKSGGSGSNSAFSRNSYAKRRRKKMKQTQHLQKQQQQTKPKSKLALTRQDSTKSSKASEASESEDQNIIKSDIELNNISNASDSKSEAIDLGKGKRKRFQNVRMLPIEEVCRSPPRKK